MNTIIIATTHAWNIKRAEKLAEAFPDYNITIISEKKDLTIENIKSLDPAYIFFPHWSWIIPAEIHESYSCVVFHRTDLPFGRGGSPLQNLISRGITETKISAIKVVSALDAGDIYLKEPLSLYGGAEEIYIRASDIIFTKMIPYILQNKPVPVPQEGEAVCFARRTPDMSELMPDMTLEQMFDYIRMLDAKGYPNAFIKFGNYKLRFSRPKKNAGSITADVEIEVNHDNP